MRRYVGPTAGGSDDDDAQRPRRIGLRRATRDTAAPAARRRKGRRGSFMASPEIVSHSPLMFAALMIGVQRAISLFTSAASGC
jgi:hypothetical protein